MGQLTVLKQISRDLANEFGPDCEVAIYDLKAHDPEHSIVHIENGHVSGRSIGDGPFDEILEFLHKKERTEADLKNHSGYLKKTSNGKILKCSTTFIHDDDGSLHYLLGIHYDVTKLTMIENALHSLTAPVYREEKARDITHNVNDLLDHLIEESVAIVGKPVSLMNKEDKVKAIQFLNDSGAFLITRSGDKVANYFGISKYTLYSYIDVNK